MANGDATRSDADIIHLNRALQRRGARMRSNINDFFEFVIRAEHTQERIKLAPHQRVGLDFIVKHDRSVNMWPVGSSKTFSMAGLSLFLLGNDVTLRGAIVSATQGQAAKPLSAVRQHIEENDRLRVVFPHLKPTVRPGEPWTQTAITVDRPLGIRDPSLVAVGIGGALPGSRLNWIIVDDILSMENTATKEQRDKVYEWFDSSVLSRLDPVGARIVVTNTAWHPDDIVHRLRARGWPTMRMDILGDVEVWCPDVEGPDGDLIEDPWGAEGDDVSAEIRPAKEDSFKRTGDVSDGELKNPGWHATLSLTAHDKMSEPERVLWPERFPAKWVAARRREHLPNRFNQLYRNICRDDATSRCKQEWVDACKREAITRGVHGFVSSYKGSNLTVTGVDLAIQLGEENDETAFFTFEVLESGHRVILDIEIGRWSGPVIVDKIFDKQRAYNSIVRVENNAAQDFIRQFALQRDISLPLRPHTTGRVKAHPEHGVEGLFVEMSNASWAIPCDSRMQVDAQTQKWIDACLYYSPTKHTPDVLMACYFAREQAKEFGALLPGDAANNADKSSPAGGVGADLMMR